MKLGVHLFIYKLKSFIYLFFSFITILKPLQSHMIQPSKFSHGYLLSPLYNSGAFVSFRIPPSPNAISSIPISTKPTCYVKMITILCIHHNNRLVLLSQNCVWLHARVITQSLRFLGLNYLVILPKYQSMFECENWNQLYNIFVESQHSKVQEATYQFDQLFNKTLQICYCGFCLGLLIIL